MAESLLQSIWVWFLDFVNQIIPNYIIPNFSLIILIVVIIVVGYVSGKIAKTITVKILNVVGLKRITARSWAESILKVTGYKGSFVELIGDLLKWLVYILFLALIIQTLGLPGVADLFTQVAVFIPRFIVAILIIAIGFIIADFFGKIFEEASRRFMGDDALAAISGGIIKYSIALISIIMALTLIGLDATSLTIMFTIILGSTVLVMVLGIKDIFPNYSSGLHLKKALKVGEHIKIGDYSGNVESVTPFSVIIRNGSKRVSIPNSIFLKLPIEKKVK
jgi:small-conductance mechanosensitive channel